MKKNKIFWLFIFSIVLIHIVDLPHFDILKKLNYTWQQYHIKFTKNVSEISISKKLFEQLDNGKNEIIIDGKYFDIKYIEFIDNETVKLIVKQDKFDLYIDIVKAFLKNHKNVIINNLKSNISEFHPLWFINFERIYFQIPVLELQRIFYYKHYLLDGFQDPLLHPPEF